jgi:hypothetical protein
MDPEELYVRVGEIVATMPNLDADLTPETHMWFGRASVVVGQALGNLTQIQFEHASERIQARFSTRESDAGLVRGLACRALAYAESRAPASARGAFIAAGDAFTALTHLRNVLKIAKRDVFIVDPYMDETALMDFGPLIPERTMVRLLAGFG